jgi:diacylglycerol kinase family enzyme
VAEVITGLAGSEVPAAIIPCGTGDQIAQNLGIGRDFEGAVEIAVSGVAAPMDLGRLDDGRYFALTAGAGWDAEVMSYATRDLKDRYGFIAYLYAAVRKTLALPSAHYRVTTDGESLEVDAAMVMVANVGQIFHDLFPVDFWVGPAVSFDDGLLDVCIYAPRHLPDVAAMLWKVSRGLHRGDPRMAFLQAERVRVEADPPQAVQIDGEVAGRTPLVARAVRGGVRVLVPG